MSDVLTYGYVQGFEDCLASLEHVLQDTAKEIDPSSRESLINAWNVLAMAIQYKSIELNEMKIDLEDQSKAVPDAFGYYDTPKVKLTVIIGGKK